MKKDKQSKKGEIEKLTVNSFTEIEKAFDAGYISDDEATARAIYTISQKINELVDKVNKLSQPK